jgi:hypothetical protein
VIPLDTVVRGDPESVHLLTEAAIPIDKRGLRCSVQSTNNRSVHPDTDLLVSSGTSMVTLFDVERERRGTTDGDAPLTLGETATVEVQLGGDGVFSGGLFVGLCETQMSCASPALSIGVTPAYREVVVGGDARFEVTVTNSGDEPFLAVEVDATINACDRDVGALPVGAESSYRCKAEGVAVDLEVSFHAAAHGQDPGCVGSDDANVRVVVEPPPPPSPPPTATTPTTTTLPPAGPTLPQPEPVTFVDDDDSIFEADIEWLAARGITKGCNPPANTMYCPSSHVTRGQMAAFLVRAMGYTDDGGGDLFVDDDGSIFEGDIDRLGTAGVTKGCNPPTNNRYCPNAKVTRGQMAAFLVRAMGYTDNGGGDLFVDDDDSIFEAAIDRLGTAGVTKGCNPPTNNRYCPTGFVTRGQMAAFLHRALG